MRAADEDLEVARPALPLLLAPLGGLWLGLYGAETLIWRGTYLPVFALAILALTGVAGAAVLIAVVRAKGIRTRRTAVLRVFCALLAAAVLGFVLGTAYWTNSE